MSFALEFDFPSEGCFFGDDFCLGLLENLKTHQFKVTVIFVNELQIAIRLNGGGYYLLFSRKL